MSTNDQATRALMRHAARSLRSARTMLLDARVAFATATEASTGSALTHCELGVRECQSALERLDEALGHADLLKAVRR